MRTVAIIQARLGSSRLPGKVLMPLAGKPVLWHIIHRLRQCRTLDAIAVATSTSRADDPVEAFAMSQLVECVRGPEDNVLARYALAAEQTQADIVVRVTGDAPLVDPAMLDELVRALIQRGADFSTGEPGVPCIHEGFCAFSRRALDKLVRQAGQDPVAREHVTAYFKEHPGFVPIAYVTVDPEYQLGGCRISVDTPADLRFLEEVYARLGVAAGDADVRDVVRLLRAAPELLKINAHVHQKGAGEVSRLVVFRCDGDRELGLGHVYRCLALADELRDSHACGVRFALVRGTIGADLIRSAGYAVDLKAGEGPEASWLDEMMGRLRPDALVLDVRSGLRRESVEAWRAAGVVVVLIDDASERRLAADLAFYPPVPQLERLDWKGFGGQVYVGWEWVLLRSQFASGAPRAGRERPVVLVTMGGSDPRGLTLKALAALDIVDDNFTTVVVLGPEFVHTEALAAFAAGARRSFDVRRDVDDMASVMRDSDLALASFGVTAYELAAMGVPALHLCLTDDHAEACSLFAREGVAVCLGVYTSVATEVMALEVTGLLRSGDRLADMSNRARARVDGRGARRIAAKLMERVARTLG